MDLLTQKELEEYSSCFSYFRDVDSDSDYYVELQKELNNYKVFITNIIEDKFHYDIFGEIESNCKKIIESISFYYNGQLDKAIQNISEIIDSKYLQAKRFLKSTLKNSIAGVRIEDFDNENVKLENYTKWERHFFKARILDTPFAFLSNDKMFHIPFNKRELIANQRYSVNGLPCLYLGSTALVCWEELDRPNFEYFYMSYFKMNNLSEVEILDLSFGYYDIISIINYILSNRSICFDAKKCLKEMLIIWPLVAASRYTVKSRNRAFKSEYIIPQIIMQSILKLQISGVAYISTKIPRNIFYTFKTNFEPKILYTNYAFPAIKNDGDDFFSKGLRDHFKVSPVFNLGSFEHSTPDQKRSIRHIEYDYYMAPMNLFGIQTYNKSIFNKFEDKLCEYDALNIDDRYND